MASLSTYHLELVVRDGNLVKYIEPMHSLKETCYFARKGTSLVNKGQNMLNMLGCKQHGHILLASI